jgi:hypothetical protein
MKTDTLHHVIHRIVPSLDPDAEVDVTVLITSVFRAAGPDSEPRLRYRYALLSSTVVEVLPNVPGHIHGLCEACTKVWRKDHGIKDNSDLAHIPFYRPKVVLDARWDAVEATLDALPKTTLKGAKRTKKRSTTVRTDPAR